MTTATRQIPLTKGYYATVDADDYDFLMQWKWYASITPNAVYASRNTPRDENGKQETIKMHRVIMNAPDDLTVDHVNGLGLDNRKVNLRVCTRAKNRINSKKNANCSSEHKGVSWHKGNKKWAARIKVDGKMIALGQYSMEEDAAAAYNEAAAKYHGEYARLNTLPTFQNTTQCWFA